MEYTSFEATSALKVEFAEKAYFYSIVRHLPVISYEFTLRINWIRMSRIESKIRMNALGKWTGNSEIAFS